MDAVFTIIREQRIWFYIFSGAISIITLRIILRKYFEYRRTIFGLEREKAIKRLTIVSILFGLSLLFGGAAFLIATYTVPSIEIIPTTTPVPTLSFLAVPSDRTTPDDGSVFNAPGDDALLVGCVESSVMISSPEDGSELSGVVNITGSANIGNFAFYKYEYRSISEGSIWRSIFASTEPVIDDNLGAWDTRLVEPGAYLFRLIVTDTSGNAPYPCVIEVEIKSDED